MLLQSSCVCSSHDHITASCDTDGDCLLAAFGGALVASNPTNPKTTVALGTIAGFGVGGVLVPAATLATSACPDELIATCVALSLSIRNLGSSIGYAI